MDSRDRCERQAPLRQTKSKEELPKNYPEDTVYCLRYTAEGKRRWDTLCVNSLTSALAARATKEAALLSATPAVASAPAKRINVNDAMATYLSNVDATRAHKTWLAYNLILNEFRKTCAKEYLGIIRDAPAVHFGRRGNHHADGEYAERH